MNILITGGAGFIGAALANKFLLDGHSVRVLDDLSAGNPDRLHSDIFFTRGDVRDKPKLWRLLKRVDCVVHLAARVSVPESILYPTEYNDTNVGGTVALMEAMRDAGVQRVVFASSGAIYGEQPASPVSEDMSPKPTSPYGVSKLSAEHYVTTIGRLWGIETVILRIFNAFGPGQPLPPEHPPVIPMMLKQALGGGSIPIYGGGSQVRDFVFIDDVVSGLAAASTAEGVNQQILNIGCGTGTSVLHIADAIGALTGRELHLLPITSESGGVTRLVADISRAKTVLGYVPRVSLRDGLQVMLEHDPRFSSAKV